MAFKRFWKPRSLAVLFWRKVVWGRIRKIKKDKELSSPPATEKFGLRKKENRNQMNPKAVH